MERLALTMGAWELIERRLWPLDEMEERLRRAPDTPERVLQLCELVAILRNAAAERDGSCEQTDAEAVITEMTVEAIPGTLIAISRAVDEGLRTEEAAGGKKRGPVDVTLERLNRRDGKSRLSWRKMTGYGLAAGVSLSEQRTRTPGEIVDWYRMRVRYDDEQHGIRRKKREA